MSAPLDISPLEPSPILGGIVERYWSGRSRPGETVDLPLLAPGVGAELVFHFGRPFSLRGGPAGSPVQLVLSRSTLLDLAPAEGLDFVAVRIRAGALGRLVPCPPAELGEGLLDGEALWGPALDPLVRRLGEAEPGDRKAHLDAWLEGALRRGRPDRAMDRVAAALYADPGGAVLDAVREGTGLGIRQFQRRFTEATGLGPKRFHGLARLYHLMRRQVLAPGGSYLPAALDLGYWDQAHAIHSFRALTGTTPLDFLERARARTHFYNPPGGGRP